MKRLGQAAVSTGGGTTLYTVPTGYRTDMADVLIANTGATPTTIALHIVPVGGSASTSNMMFPSVTIPANTLVQWTGTQHLNTGDFIKGVAGASGITVTITGEEVRL